MNYEFKGSKGKWLSIYDDNGFYYIINQTGGLPSQYISATGAEGDKDKANSLLQSKAPEMFEMLKKISEGINSMSFDQLELLNDDIEQLLKEATEL